MMMNKNLNLLLKINSPVAILDNGPFTPLDQTLKTPVDPPNANYFAQNSFNNQFHPPNPPSQVYSNPSYSESDDILTDVDEGSGLRAMRNYSLSFTNHFDSLVMSVYSHILSLPTTTPFSGTIPPSGLVSRVANETMHNLISSFSSTNVPVYDQQQIISREMLSNTSFQPIFLQLIRKRLIELCSNKNNTSKLPQSTSISAMSGTQPQGNPYHGNNPYSSNGKQSSLSNLSLTEMNINQYHEQQAQNKTRSSSINLRKQSLTRNNSYSNNANWLHVGNLSTIRNPNGSTDLLQSMQDYVPQPFINRSENNSTITPTNPSFGFNNMMMDYQTPPSSNKSSFSTPPNNYNNIQIVQNSIAPNGTGNRTTSIPNSSEYDDFNFGQRSRSSSSSRLNSFPRPLTINTDNANLQALNMLSGTNDTLDSPFMSATTPSDDFSMMQNSFANGNSIPQSPIVEEREEKFLPTKISLSEKKRDSLKLKRGIH